MAGQPLVRADGVRKLRADLRRAGLSLADVKDANRAAGNVVVQAAAPRAPRRSGKLAQSGRASAAAARVTVLWGGATVPYAGPQHWGWPARGIDGVPFVSDAAVATEPLWLPAYERALADAFAPLTGRTY